MLNECQEKACTLPSSSLIPLFRAGGRAVVDGVIHEWKLPFGLRLFFSLLHLQAQQVRLGAARSGRVIAIFLVESLTALVESVDEPLALLFLVTGFGEAVCFAVSLGRT